MKVSILTPDLSHNCLGRAHVMAQLIENKYNVEIIGPKLKPEVWSPVKDDYDYRSVDTSSRMYSFVPAVPKLLSKIEGDVVLASKPRFESYGIALLKSISTNFPLVLDIDDWETGFLRRRGDLFAYAWGLPTLINAGSFYYTRLFEALSDIADARTVSNTFLQNKFGGEIIPHARDTTVFDPSKFDKYAIREKFGLPKDDFLVMFSGTPRPHKGVKSLVQAVATIDEDDIRLVLVGAQESKYLNQLRQLGGDSLIIRGQQPFNEIPEWIAAADLVSIPQQDSVQTRGQLPAKVFDAMAMAKPIVATKVSDLPEILSDCGYLVDPESNWQLQSAIEELFSDQQLRESLGRKAREKCINKYSHEAVAPRLTEVIETVTQ